MNIHDLARRLNISIGTVSRALNDRAGVSKETRKRVLDAAKKHGYSPDQSGRSLRRGATGMVGFMVVANTNQSIKGEPFFMTIFDGMQSALAKRSLDLVIYYCGAEQSPETYVKRIVERRLVDGLIVSQTTRRDKRIDYLIEQHVPFIAFGRSQSGGGHSWLDLDFEGVAERSVDLLVSQGHRRIAVATTAGEVNFGHVYREACRAALKRHGLRLDEELILDEQMSESGGYAAGERLLALADRPTAVMVVENSMAIGLYNKLQEAGVAPGRDIAVVGFDQSSTTGLFLRPRLTQFRLNLIELGAWLGDHMLALIDAKQSGKAPQVTRKIWPMEMVLGGSTEMRVASGDAESASDASKPNRLRRPRALRTSAGAQ
ncbi:MAG: LacI family transcriptional regulator [Bradyrhizobium sp.]|nr:MAG: LacI family transcriptional regulator [Bradyrhizobium sp.]